MNQPTLEVTNVHKRLVHTQVLRGVSFTAEAGAVVAIVGANGSGKSTLLRVLSGQIMADEGSVRVCGSVLGAVAPDARSHLAYAPDHSEAFLELTGLEFLHLCYGLRRVTPGPFELEVQRAWELESFAGRRMRELSFGQRKRICLAAAVGGTPEVLLLDEPTNGIDVATSDYLTCIVQTRQQQGKVTLAATHDPRVLGAWKPAVFHLSNGAGAWQ